MWRVGRLATVAALVAAACQSSSPGSIPGDAGDAGENGAGSDATLPGDAGPDAQGTGCALPSDCRSFPIPGPALACCVHDLCLYGDAALTQTCSDAATQDITASNYDQSCRTDSDCVAIAEGNFCDPGANNGCTNAAINKSALAQYRADLAKTQAAVCYGLSGCPLEVAPCCRSGVCGTNAQCVNALTKGESADASTSAGDHDAMSDGGD
jgi:hypothetical protein